MAVCELQATQTHNSRFTPAELRHSSIAATWFVVHRVENTVFKRTYNIALNEVVVMCVAVRRALFTVDTPSIKMAWRVEWPT